MASRIKPFRKAVKECLGHLSASAQEFPMANLAPTYGVPDSNIVGRVSDHYLGLVAAQEPLVVNGLKGVTTQKPMSAKLPKVTKFADGWALQRKARQIVGRILGRRLSIEEEVDFAGAELGQFH